MKKNIKFHLYQITFISKDPKKCGVFIASRFQTFNDGSMTLILFDENKMSEGDTLLFPYGSFSNFEVKSIIGYKQ